MISKWFHFIFTSDYLYDTYADLNYTGIDSLIFSLTNGQNVFQIERKALKGQFYDPIINNPMSGKIAKYSELFPQLTFQKRRYLTNNVKKCHVFKE